MNGWAHLRDKAPGQDISEEAPQRWRAIGDIVSDLTDLGIPRLSALIVLSSTLGTLLLLNAGYICCSNV